MESGKWNLVDDMSKVTVWKVPGHQYIAQLGIGRYTSWLSIANDHPLLSRLHSNV